jgi:hypothetical protein
MAREAVLSPAVKAYVRLLGSKGGKARSRALSKDERKKAASDAVNARWRKSTKAERSAAARRASRARWSRAKTKGR